MELKAALERIIAHALENSIIGEADTRWAYNRLLEAVGDLDADERRRRSSGGLPEAGQSFFDALDRLTARALINGATHDEEEAVARIMGSIMPRPSEVSARFDALLAASPRDATDYLYALAVDTDYVKTRAIGRNLEWLAPSRWGDLEITINLSKPEKDPNAIASAASTPLHSYPACQLCMENEGYTGRSSGSGLGPHPARQNLRIAPISIGGETWGLQYSPYAYYEEHCIAMSGEHRPMRIDRACLERLLELVDMLPHYFFGSNADLPIVGGSILSHDHFQGGLHTFPMELAEDGQSTRIAGFDDIRAHMIEWPVSVLRLTGDNPRRLADAADAVLQLWSCYDDPAAGIVSHTGPERHNTVTPIARRRKDAFELDLALRCNVTSEEHPLGVFHPHEELHHIKKENIGLIEVMGLAILPARLARELAAVEALLVAGAACEADFASDPFAAPHATWAAGIAERHPGLASNLEVSDVLRDEVGLAFAQVLEHVGVFKHDVEGRAAQARFLAALAADRP